MTKFLKDGLPHDPRAARQQAAKAAAKTPPQQPQRLPVKRNVDPPGMHRRAPAAAQEAYDTIMAQKQRQEGFRQAGQGQRFLPDEEQHQVQQQPNRQPPQGQQANPGQQQRPRQRAMGIVPMENGKPTMRPQQQAVPPSPLLPPTEAERVVESVDSFEMDERYQEVYLPSRFLPYSFKRIYVRQLERSEIKAIIRAKASGSYRHLLTALGQTINVDPTILTLGDFWYLMYWHRINSYKKTPFVVSWDCKDEGHAKRMALAKDHPGYLAPESVKNQLQVNASNLQEVNIDEGKYLAVANRIFEEHGLQLTPQTVGDFADMMEEEEEDQLKQQAREHKLGKADIEDEDGLMKILLELQEEAADVEVRMYGFRHAAVLSKVHGVTLADRDAFLDTFPPEIDSDLEEFIQVSEHGVNETFRVKCEGCGASKEIKSSLDALSFLPSHIVGGAA